MISLSRGLSPAHAKSYYLRELAAPENQIDLESGRPRHQGSVAVHLGLLDPESHGPRTFRNLCDGLSPDGLEVLVAPRNGWQDSATRRAARANARNAGWDLNCSPDKSVSVAALVLGDARIVDAHRAAVAEALQVIETTMSTRTSDGRRAEKTGALLATTFDHGVSRELDPQLHTHVFIHNITVDVRGRTRAVYIPPTFRAREEIGAAYQQALAARLEALGYRITREAPAQSVRIADIPEELLVRFSTRSRKARERASEIRSETGPEHGRRAPSARTLHRWAASSSRPRRPRHLEWPELRARWSAQVRESGFDPEIVAREALGPAREPASRLAPEAPTTEVGDRNPPAARPPDAPARTTSRSENALPAPSETGRKRSIPAASAAFAARDTVDALAASVTDEGDDGLRPLGRLSDAAGHAMAAAVEGLAEGGFFERLRETARRIAPAAPPLAEPPQAAPPVALETHGSSSGDAPRSERGEIAPNGPRSRTARSTAPLFEPQR